MHIHANKAIFGLDCTFGGNSIINSTQLHLDGGPLKHWASCIQLYQLRHKKLMMSSRISARKTAITAITIFSWHRHRKGPDHFPNFPQCSWLHVGDFGGPFFQDVPKMWGNCTRRRATSDIRPPRVSTPRVDKSIALPIRQGFLSYPRILGQGYWLPSGKLTWLAGKWTWIEDVFPIENGEFPLLCLITGV